jgi:Flp pilus assembly protein TadG
MRWKETFSAGWRFNRFARMAIEDRRATFAVTFSLAAPVFILLAGLGVDYLTGLSFKARWDASADAASLAAVETATNYVKTNAATMTASTLVANAEAAGNAAGIQAFNANAGPSKATASVTPTVVVSQSGTSFSATTTYTGAVPTHFGTLIGAGTFGASGSSVASATLTTYINYYILVDISQSMGVGDTATDMTNLYNLTKSMGYLDDGDAGCVFGCHVALQNRPLTNEQIAHGAGITLRIDSAKTAIQNVINQAQANANNGNVKIGLYTLQLNSTNSAPTPHYEPMTIQSLTSNFSSLTSAVGTIDLGPNTTNGWGDSDIVDSISYFTANVLPSDGNGFSANSPKNYVFLITDGVMDVPSSSCLPTWHCTGAMPSGACTQMKTQATVGVIYTTYLPIYLNNDSTQGYEGEYATLVAPFASQIQPALLSCATNSSWFFQADNGPELVAAMNTLFTNSSQPVHLLQ